MKRVIVFGIILFFLGLSFAPSVYELSRYNEVVPGRAFELVHNYVTDYHFYLSRIREGWEGRWTVVERYTSEPHAGSFIQELYLLLGVFARHIPDSFIAVTGSYHAARIIFGALFFFLAWLWVKRLFHTFIWQIIAFLMVVTASSWPILVILPDGMWLFGCYMSWWTVIDPNQRATFMPHITLGTALMLFLVAAMTHGETRVKKRNWPVIGLFALALGMVFPPGLIFIVVVMGVFCLTEGIHGGYFKNQASFAQFFQAYIIPLSVIFLISLPSLLYYQYMLSIYPWKRLMEFDILNPTYINVAEYLKALGPTLPFGLLGLIIACVKKDTAMRPMVAWTVAWMALFYIFHLFPKQSPLRFTEMATNVPLGILTAYGLYTISNLKFQISKGQRKFQKFLYHGVRFMAYLLSFTIILLGLGWWMSSYMWQRIFINTKVIAGYPAIAMNNYIVYSIQSVMDGMKFLEKNTPPDAIILSGYPAGNQIPAYAGRTVYLGHDNTVDREKKDIEVSVFFQHGMTADDAKDWLIQKHISYIFVGPQELEWVGEKPITTYYPFLKKEFSKDFVTIYSY